MIIKKPYVLESVEKTCPDVSTFRFKAQDGTALDFTPGMFAMLYYKDSGTGEEIGRAFSIANAPPSDHLEFIIRMIHGELTSKMELAKPGDVYYVSAPYGQFKFDISAGKKFLFLAGGTGIAPFFSMLRYVASTNTDIDVNLVYSVRYPSEIIDETELNDFAKNTRMKLTVTVTRPQPGDNWTGQTGHIDTELIKKCAPNFAERISYVCGPPAFAKAVKQSLVELGVDEKAIKAEIWGE